jgi:hypothetical protein
MRPTNGGICYLRGQKRCQVCQVFIHWQGSYCPCCGYKLRVNPRNSKFKLTLRRRSKNNIQHNNKKSITNLVAD